MRLPLKDSAGTRLTIAHTATIHSKSPYSQANPRYNHSMARKFYTGIDIGTQQVKVVIAAQPESAELPLQILASASAPARGVRQGYIVERAEAAKSVREAIARAQSAARVVVKHARVAIGGIGLEEMRSSGDTSFTPPRRIGPEPGIQKTPPER